MIKSVKVSSTQTDDEVDLFGGYHIDGKYCQKFELLLSACNGAPINNFKITFDYGNAINAGNCFTEDQFFYKETAQGSSSLLGSVNRTLNENSVTFNLLDDYVPACTSKSITFYVCTSYMCSFSQLNVSVDLMNADGCPDRQLTFI